MNFKKVCPILMCFFVGLIPAIILPNSQSHTLLENHADLDSIKIGSQNVRVVFWNVENLYDPYDDTTKLDNEFTSSGARRWTFSRFLTKLNHIAKTLLSIGGWEAPAIVGMCEVENRYVMNKLIYETPLKAWKYKCIHHESPDMRGIDVALLYRPALFKPDYSRSISIRFPFDTLAQTREILMVRGILYDKDTITLFINHWPSRRGGTEESQPRRNYVATVLRKLVDSIQNRRIGADLEKENPVHLSNILIMGDFNDEPFSKSILEVLGARSDTAMAGNADLVNLMSEKVKTEGSHKFRGQWSILDQFIISRSLLNGEKGLKINSRNVHIYRSGFLLNEDPAFFGDKPNRTYNGPRYNGGFSDHLPIYLDIAR